MDDEVCIIKKKKKIRASYYMESGIWAIDDEVCIIFIILRIAIKIDFDKS